MIQDEQTGNWQRVRKRIVNYNGNVYKRKTWYNKRRKLYVKVSNYFDSGLYDRITQLVPKAYPGNLVSHHHSDRSMTFTYKPIQGTVLSSWCVQWTEELYDQVYQWLCDDLDRTWPIVHGDWAPGNIIQNKDGFHLIDYDEIYDAYKKPVSKDLVRKTIREHIVKGVPYLKLARNS